LPSTRGVGRSPSGPITGQADDLATKQRTIPPLLQTARRNLDGAPATPASDAVLEELLVLERAALDLVRPALPVDRLETPHTGRCISLS
jgi:hypothetical protein